MMDPSKINRPVATVNRDAWFIKFYLWLWVADIEKIDFCRLFWGYVFAIPMLVIKLFLYPIFAIWDGLVWIKRTGIWRVIAGVEWVLDHIITPPIRWVWDRIPAAPVERRKTSTKENRMLPAAGPTYALPPKKPSRILAALKSLRSNGGEKFLSGVGKAADKGVSAAQVGWPYVKWIFIAFGLLLGAVLAAVTGYAIWMLIQILPVVIGSIGVALAATGAGIAWFFVTVFTSEWALLVPLVIIGIIGLLLLGSGVANSRPVRRASKKSAEGTLKFGGAMKLGMKSVKYRTCPVIKIESEKS